ncbi:MAG: NPCBM/NEW2 domain-containing protein, partial [Candidatus Hydrogenedentes bacterium]|nr:NPCBM/NEW2 domain-containing protein [Candidatus Hydrogenedentota bacterium]
MNGVLIAWLAASLLDQPAREINLVPGIEVVRSDIGELAVGRSNWGTPLRIGEHSFERGLGTHCVSEILVRLPSAGVSFDASVGLDSDPTILGRGGSVVFGVEIAGNCIWRSSPCVRGENPIPVHVDLQGTREFTLKVLEVERGYNHADWAEPVVMLADGKRVDV